MAEKPFEPTAARLARAAREGDVARSQDVGAVAALATASLGLAAALPFGASAATSALRDATRGTSAAGAYATLAGVALAVLVCGILGSIGAAYGQTLRFTLVPLKLKLDKLSPAAGLKKMVGKDTAIGALKAAVVAGAVGATLVPVVRDAFGALATLGAPVSLAALVRHALGTAVASAVGVAGVFGIADVLLERKKRQQRLRMTYDEIKREHKQNEGDPHVRGRRRAAHRGLLRGSVAKVREAAFVVVNPTHVAIAFAYDPPDIAVPRVLVRAIDDGAIEVRRIARDAGVPIVENVPLARALLAIVDVGDDAPPEFYGALAAIVASLAREVRR